MVSKNRRGLPCTTLNLVLDARSHQMVGVSIHQLLSMHCSRACWNSVRTLPLPKHPPTPPAASDLYSALAIAGASALIVMADLTEEEQKRMHRSKVTKGDWTYWSKLNNFQNPPQRRSFEGTSMSYTQKSLDQKHRNFRKTQSNKSTTKPSSTKSIHIQITRNGHCYIEQIWSIKTTIQEQKRKL